MSDRETIKRAWKQLEDGDIDNLNIDDLMTENSMEEFKSYVKDWMVNRTSIAVYVTSLSHTFYSEYMTEAFNSNKDESFNRMDNYIRGYIEDIVSIITPFCRKGTPYLEKRVSSEYSVLSQSVMVCYQIAINKHDLNYLKIKKPDLYNKVSSHTINNPMRVT